MEFKDYYLLDKVKIGPYTFEVILSGASGRYYLNGESHSGRQIFNHLEVEKQAYVMSIVGYECCGLFPEVKTLEDLNKVIKQLQIDFLIKEAKEKYPKGTDFRALYNNLDYESSGEFKWLSKEYELRDAKFSHGIIWANNRWAKIVAGNPKQPEINTYGLKVGDELSPKVLNEWAKHGENRQQKDEKGGKWHKCNSTFIGNRTIESFKNIDGVIGFLVSGTNEVYLRAEGFKEFAESFDKPKFEVGKWYKYGAWYLKYSHTRDDIFIASEYISDDKRYASNLNNFTCGFTDNDKILITDLSEIQQYLPDGHPDKIIKKKYTLGELVDKKIIVYIDSEEEFNKIVEAAKNIQNFKSTSRYWGKYCYNFKHGDYSLTSSKTTIGGYESFCTIITFDDIIFTEESMNYVGRYIRILQDNPVGADVKKGDIFQIKRQRDEIIYYSEKEWIMNFHYNLGKLFELMPEDCNPDVSAIRINPNTDFIFEPNGYYVGEWEQEGNERVIFKTTTNKLSDLCYSIDTTNVYQYSKTGCCTAPDITFRKANQDEIQWLDECIKQGKTIPYEMAMVNKKSVNKWSPGTYVFIEKKVPGILVPELSIHKINLFKDDCIHIHGDCLHIDREEDGQIKWFATLKEAEAYKLSLIGTIGSDFSKQEYLQAYPITFDDSIFTDEQKQLNNIKDDKPIIDINKYQVDLSVKSALETNYKYFNNN